MYIIIPIGSMVLLYMLAWIPSIYPIYLSIYTVPYMDPSWDIYIYILVPYTQHPLGPPRIRPKSFAYRSVSNLWHPIRCSGQWLIAFFD